ncbi:hypothetical protein IV203_033574 [Nitzschia inconspicua]|uniref:Uncharacterized protein n=1 Tax=Nitzschia inconspicua TaxID=303405 RepID=A0A9K3Q748_9STRA|nr:hypothetical protein IV203_033574 [Nitzschia inconspicua]
MKFSSTVQIVAAAAAATAARAAASIVTTTSRSKTEVGGGEKWPKFSLDHSKQRHRITPQKVGSFAQTGGPSDRRLEDFLPKKKSSFLTLPERRRRNEQNGTSSLPAIKE